MSGSEGRMSLLESLEPRTLRSVSPAVDTPPDPNPPPADCVSADTIAADRQQVQDDSAKLASDRAACEQMLQQKRDALDAARQALETQAAPLRQKLATDRASCQQMLQADRTALQNASRAGLTTIINDVKAIIAARNDPAALKAAQDKLAADRDALQAALKPLLDKLQKDATDCATLLAADQKAISDLFANDPTVQAAQDALAAARKECADKIAADLATLSADRQKLEDDLEHQCDDNDDDDDDDHQDTRDENDDDDNDDNDNHEGDGSDQGGGDHQGDDHQGNDGHQEFVRRLALRRSPFAG